MKEIEVGHFKKFFFIIINPFLMEHGCCSSVSCKGKALVLLVLGVLFLLGTLGVWPEFTFTTYWPLFLIVWGLHKLFCPCTVGK